MGQHGHCLWFQGLVTGQFHGAKQWWPFSNSNSKQKYILLCRRIDPMFLSLILYPTFLSFRKKLRLDVTVLPSWFYLIVWKFSFSFRSHTLAVLGNLNLLRYNDYNEISPAICLGIMVFEWQQGRDFQANLGVEDDGAVDAKSLGALP